MNHNDNFWTNVLRDKGLESPGREEAVAETLEYIKQKKARAELDRKEKQKKKGKK